MSKFSCEIIKDLLPLYYDNICSEDSKRVVEEHLVECDGCKRELDRIEDEIIIPKKEIEKNKNDGNAIKNIYSMWKRSNVKSFFIGVIISALLFSLIIGVFWFVTGISLLYVPTNAVDIKVIKYLLLTSFVISLFFDWRKYRKNVEKAKGEEEIRQKFVPFLMSIILFLIFLVTLIY
ncbi:zf-HC2 domain-containing protein [Halalkalibacter urbisdiaboli]|uniref:zf-HC2 domain-containing protein n=1 Tax=Halalkalibacter urbisdiaboli TaxID=1960589 RepID=UPI000B4399EE|nr:zf-HC2 domain-containing protein [Halalkalibacter urbisdiaboli]